MTTLDSPDANSPNALSPGANRPDTTVRRDAHSLDHGNAVEVVRSEQRLDVGTVVRVSGRAVLRRYVVTETVTQTFQVRHEEFRVDHEPLPEDYRVDSGHGVVDGQAFTDRVLETVLHREVPVITMQVVPTERVRVHVDTVTDQVQVAEELASERIDVDVQDQPGAPDRA